jgi:hypothetical protein
MQTQSNNRFTAERDHGLNSGCTQWSKEREARPRSRITEVLN